MRVTAAETCEVDDEFTERNVPLGREMEPFGNDIDMVIFAASADDGAAVYVIEGRRDSSTRVGTMESDSVCERVCRTVSGRGIGCEERRKGLSKDRSCRRIRRLAF